MSNNPYDLQRAVAELIEALKPLESLAESMRGLEKTQRLQADLQLIDQCYSDEERQSLYALLDAAKEADSQACETLALSVRRGTDARTFEQYAQAHGEQQAKRAFTPRDDAVAISRATQKRIEVLEAANPVLYRVRAQIKSGW